MKIGVVGATRGIGRRLVELALGAEHEVKVLVRDAGRVPIAGDGLEVIQGDILEEASVARLVEGCDGVSTTIGIPPTRRPVRVFSAGIGNVIAAMKSHGVRRLVAVTGIGAGDSRGHGGFLYDRIVQPLLLRTIYEDKDREEARIRASGLDWTIVRPGFLTNAPASPIFRVELDLEGVTAGRISRIDVAQFVLEELGRGKYVGQTPLLTT